MTFDEFKASLALPAPPPDLAGPLLALWHDARGNWDAAHEIAQDVADESGAWVHAYLHRKEGDPGNAAYWYRRARKPEARVSLDEEWALIVSALLA
jgi:dienelactone hydrolase